MDTNYEYSTKGDRRHAKRLKARRGMKLDGKGIGVIYANAVGKRNDERDNKSRKKHSVSGVWEKV